MVLQGFGPIPGAAYNPPSYARSNIHTLTTPSTEEDLYQQTCQQACQQVCQQAMALQATVRAQTTLVDLQGKEVEHLTAELSQIEQRQEALDLENQNLLRRVNKLKKLAGCALGVSMSLAFLSLESGVSAYRIVLNGVVGGAMGLMIGYEK